MDRITKQIADFAARLTFNAIPNETVHAATQRFIDTLGCALGGHDPETAQAGRGTYFDLI